ncbi:class I SAM-dependent methyltransferase [Carboxydothermus pertinax]|uniref:SAM-dependent methyltransferase n=1 Tax=Carboxydothermus pertinax TaxID=870242 RepID=A0A1L8CXJ1_9THEO|nr:class I SAM-dependent methyltransferase [Carboxydothermus pertinax]GAV23638.1 hypothetical protein cpu_21480 [Carboxydothermus pertinax]
MEEAIITTSLNPDIYQVERAKELAEKFGFLFVERNKKSLIEVARGLPVLLVTKNRLEVVFSDKTKLYFHPGMAKIRIKGIKKGQQDIMVKAMGLASGMSLLDCTLGLAQDGIVAQYVIKDGLVVGLEKSKIIYVLTSEGLKAYDEDPDLIIPMRKLKAEFGDFNEYLTSLPPKSFDVVYFDPMFKNTTGKSAHILRLRKIAAKDYINKYVLKKAREIARERVVVKGRKEEIKTLPFFDKIIAGNDSEIAFGIIEGQI